ncbi:recombinase family protein [Gordonia sp. NPDC003424]
MNLDPPGGSTVAMLGYARAGVGADTLAAQVDALTKAGVDPSRIYSDEFAGVSVMPRRPGLSALLDYARPGDTTIVVGIDRLGRTTAEVLATARDLSQRGIGVRSLREGIDTDDPAGAMIVGVLASLGEVDAERGQTRRHAAAVSRSGSTSSVGRPRVLDDDQVAMAERMRAGGRPVPDIAETLGVSRATLYRSLAERRVAR